MLRPIHVHGALFRPQCEAARLPGNYGIFMVQAEVAGLGRWPPPVSAGLGEGSPILVEVILIVFIFSLISRRIFTRLPDVVGRVGGDGEHIEEVVLDVADRGAPVEDDIARDAHGGRLAIGSAHRIPGRCGRPHQVHVIDPLKGFLAVSVIAHLHVDPQAAIGIFAVADRSDDVEYQALGRFGPDGNFAVIAGAEDGVALFHDDGLKVSQRGRCEQAAVIGMGGQHGRAKQGQYCHYPAQGVLP
ncbi:hypothetical protein HNE_0846 [Hyphomonas neptunium ATCC 15444]|uniref:Uncharacterized protein n=1 Tax=Hyphomonas neptunium (strain ATCC 15444) TaxID=228405 RepID=Q0C3X1_HYPNA|nr:hypothetical protein HNE_0846 [Hyphomonas neptunium ATCC 15444]